MFSSVLAGSMMGQKNERFSNFSGSISTIYNKDICHDSVIEEFMLMVVSWVNRAILREIQRFVLEFKTSYFFLNSYIWYFLFEKSNLRVQRNNTLNLECKEVRDQFLENFGFPIHFL